MRATLYLSLWLAALCSVSGQRACKQSERCVSIQQCPSLARLVSKGHVTAAQKALLRAAVCGWARQSAHIPQVCCPLVPLDVCGPQNTPDKITNGNTTVVKEFPWAARLGYRTRGRIDYQCAATLISERYLVTAAHCSEGKSRPVTVRLGEHDVESDRDCSVQYGLKICADPVVDVDVEEVVKHPEYEPDTNKASGLWNDIALVRMRRAVTFSDSVMPLCLPLHLAPGPDDHDRTQQAPGEYSHIAIGWGKISSDEYADTSRYLLKAFLREMDHPLCVAKYSAAAVRIDAKRQMCCVGKDGQDVCRGDSGGALSTVAILGGKVVNVLTGVVSFGPKFCGTEGVPAVFTRVSNYLPWILANLKTR